MFGERRVSTPYLAYPTPWLLAYPTREATREHHMLHVMHVMHVSREHHMLHDSLQHHMLHDGTREHHMLHDSLLVQIAFPIRSWLCH